MTDDERTTVTVFIGGEEHVLRTSADPEYTRRCAHLVDERISEVRRRLSRLEPHKAAILAALSLADELFETREHLGRLEESAAKRIEALTLRLRDAGAGRDSPGGDGE